MRAAKAATGHQSTRTKAYRIKVIMVGEAFCGKTCLVNRYSQDRFLPKYSCTIGVDHVVKRQRYGDYDVRVNLWDLGGAPEFLEVRNEFYKDAQGCLLTYDVTNRGSFESLGRCLQETKEHSSGGLLTLVVGTKCDALPNRKVTEKEGREWAAAQGLLHFEVSALSGQNVEGLFATICARLLAVVPGIPQELVQLAARKVPSTPSFSGERPSTSTSTSAAGGGPYASSASFSDRDRDRDSKSGYDSGRGGASMNDRDSIGSSRASHVRRDSDGAGGGPITIAEVAAEIARILASRNDYDCLKVTDGATLSQIKSSYRRLAIAIHPDKCSLGGAAQAFQRINAAHTNLNKGGG